MIHPQLHQLVNLLLLLLVGKVFEHIYMSWFNIVFVLFATFIIEHCIIYLKHKKILYFSYSSLSTSIGIILMIVTPYLWICLLIISLGLLQKHFITFEGKHFFNPSNFALIMGLLLFYTKSHIVLGQLGHDLYLGMAILLFSLAILYRVNRWLIPLVFSVTYLFLQYILVVSYDPVLIMEEIYYRFHSVSFIVFIVFMLTDPKTTPSLKFQQVIFAMLVAIIAVTLDRLVGFRVQHLFMALFLMSLLVPLASQWFKTKQLQKLFIYSFGLFLLALSVIISIESKAPYYFEMNY